MIADILDWTANEGFPKFLEMVGEKLNVDTDWESAHHFRQRHLVNAVIEGLKSIRTISF